MTHHYILHSGGLDSTVLLADLCNQHSNKKVTAVGINYGQRHLRELEAAHQIRHALNVNHLTLDLTGYGTSVTSALTTPTINVPHANYDADNMAQTVVPGRNAVMLAALAGIAASQHPEGAHIHIATHGGDHHIYPDCRPDFIQAIDHALQLATGVQIHAPYVHQSKTDIVTRGHQLNAPLHLTWSCYEGGQYHCGQCGTCLERRQAFTQAHIPDPTHYAH